MPKTLSETERAYIKERLKTETEKCLATYGIRKTTIDELVKRVGIPKGTFYLFYESKEQLLYEVIMESDKKAQEQLLQEVASLPGVPDVDQFTDIILRFYRQMDDSFLPRLMHSGELEYFMRTVPPEFSRQHAERDQEAMQKIFAAFPGMQSERAAVLGAAFRGVFDLAPENWTSYNVRKKRKKTNKGAERRWQERTSQSSRSSSSYGK